MNAQTARITNAKITPDTWADLPFVEAIDQMRLRNVVLPDDYYGSKINGYRMNAFSIAGIMQADLLQRVLNDLSESMKRGTSFSDWKKTVNVEALMYSDARLDLIYRTNLQGAYNVGIYTQQARVKEIFPYLQYRSVNDGRTRPSHRLLNGFIARYDDPIWNTHRPALGYNCRCTLVQLTEQQAIDRGYQVQKRPTDKNGAFPQPDKGWDYDKTKGIQYGIEQAQRRSIAALPLQMQDKAKQYIASSELLMRAYAPNILAQSAVYSIARKVEDLGEINDKNIADKAAELWTSQSNFDKHAEKRIKYDEVASKDDYARVIFETIANATAVTLTLKAGQPQKHKLIVRNDEWVIIFTETLEIVTAYYYNQKQPQFEDKAKDNGLEIYTYELDSRYREILKKLFGSNGIY